MHKNCFLEVDLNEIRKNYKILENICKVKIYPVVKSNAYGLGLKEVVKSLIKINVNNFAINSLEEAQIIRNISQKSQLLILSPCSLKEKEIIETLNLNLIISITNLKSAEILNKISNKQNKIAKIHLKINTGMNRFGLEHNKAIEAIKKIKNMANINLTGIFTHFSNADSKDKSHTKEQISKFLKIKNTCDKLKINCEYHMANSSGIINFPKSHLNAVRPGILLYGSYPSKHIKSLIKMNKVIKLKTKIIEIKNVPQKEYISYGLSFQAKQNIKVGIIDIGYADGFPRLLSNKALAIVKKKKTKVIGNICMQYSIINLSEIKNAKIEDEVTLIGDGITEEQIAEDINSIPYEVLNNIKNHIPRIYKNI